jgi:riboflavin biosynthesis pyrimidine reductase
MSLDLGMVIAELHRRGLRVLLTEGGPHVMGRLLERSLLDEVFLTISPLVAGRGQERRLGMVEGVELLPGTAALGRLLSARRHGDYLFLRYGLRQA